MTRIRRTLATAVRTYIYLLHRIAQQYVSINEMHCYIDQLFASLQFNCVTCDIAIRCIPVGMASSKKPS